ncbi:hypothetical protein KEM56_004712, partial [Ascosphaera pollenicola]
MRPRARKIWRRALLKRQKPCSPAVQGPALAVAQEIKDGRDDQGQKPQVGTAEIRLSSDEVSRASYDSELNGSSNSNSNSNSNSTSNSNSYSNSTGNSNGSGSGSDKKKSSISNYSLMSTRAKRDIAADTISEVKEVETADAIPIIVLESQRNGSTGDENDDDDDDENGSSSGNGNGNRTPVSNGNSNASSTTGDESAESTPRASREEQGGRPSSVT